MKNRSAGFTLAELLAVIAILAVVMAMAVPAFVGLSRGSNMDTSISGLRTTLMQARQWAITHREATHVVFPHHSSAIYSGNEESVEKAFRGYNAYTESEGYIGEWRYLEPGIFFIPNPGLDPRSPGVVSAAKNPFSRPVTEFVDVDFPEWAEPKQRMPVVTFKPDGTVAQFGYTELYLGEGIRTVDYGAGGITDLSFKEESPVFGLQIAQLTGLVSVKDYQPLAPPP